MKMLSSLAIFLYLALIMTSCGKEKDSKNMFKDWDKQKTTKPVPKPGQVLKK